MNDNGQLRKRSECSLTFWGQINEDLEKKLDNGEICHTTRLVYNKMKRRGDAILDKMKRWEEENKLNHDKLNHELYRDFKYLAIAATKLLKTL